MSKGLLSGWAESDITPEGKDIELSGQYYQRVSQGIHSRLKAIVLVMEQGEETTVMVSLDLVGIPEDFCQHLQKSISIAIPKITTSKIIINAIHTHNAPDTQIRTNRDWRRGTQGNDAGVAYRELVEVKVLEAVEKAWNSRQPAGISNVLEYARVGHCRRAVYTNGTAEMYGRVDRDDFMGMEGGEDSGVDLLFFFDKEGTPTGVIVNVACPSQVMEATYKISSDYMGALREKNKQEFGVDFITLPQISSAGCQSPRDLSRNYKGEPDFWHEDGVEVLSDRLFDAVKRGYRKSAESIVYDAEMRHSTKSIELPRRRVSYLDYLKSLKEINRLKTIRDTEDAFNDFLEEVHKNEQIHGRPGPYDSKLHHFVRIKNEEAVIERFKNQDYQPNFTMELHVVRIGDVVFSTNPFETYLIYGQQIKARSPAFQTFVIQLANGIGQYLPSERAEKLGGYGGMIINGSVGFNGGNKMVDETICAINRVFK